MKNYFLLFAILTFFTSAILFISIKLYKNNKNNLKINKNAKNIKLKKTVFQSIFENPSDDYYLFSNHRKRYKVFGSKEMQKFYSTHKTAQTVSIQYSSRKRLYDHNLLLRAIFKSRIIHKQYGNLKNLFKETIFFDLGSAILYKQGAMTVRDIYEDKEVYPYLSKLIASDINNYKYKKTQFINIYRKRNKKLPFPVEEISMSITQKSQIDKMLSKYLNNAKQSVIFRTVNTGIDYFYKEKQLRKHFKAILLSMQNRNVMYFFNRFILFKSKQMSSFQIIGEIFEKMFAVEKGKNWLNIYWKNRSLEDGFIPAKSFIRIQ